MFILNEKNYAEDCIKNGIAGKKPLLSTSIIARYLYHCRGMKGKKIIAFLTDFIHRNGLGYGTDESYWDEKIEKVAKDAKKYPLHEIDGVPITESELATIEGIHNKLLERLAFTVLCIAKLNNLRNPKNNGWINTEDREVFKLARISGTVMERRIRLGRLFRLGLLENSKRIDNLSYRVTFIDVKSDSVLFIDDFRELGNQYLKFKGENLFICAKCGILAKGNKNRTKRYCNACSAYIPMESKLITCIDCGETIKVEAKNNRAKRCPACQADRNRELSRIRAQRRREILLKST